MILKNTFSIAVCFFLNVYGYYLMSTNITEHMYVECAIECTIESKYIYTYW